MIKEKISKLIISIFIVLLIGITASYFTSSSIETWYLSLDKPSFNPPNYIFAPVWTILYIMIGISFYKIWEKGFGKNKNLTIGIYSFQLLFNFLWSFSFFYLENPFLGLLNIAILWLVIIINIIIFYKVDKISGIILIPYILWVSFASILNYYLYILN